MCLTRTSQGNEAQPQSNTHLEVAEGNGELRKIDETGCEVICGAPSTLAVKG